MLGFILVAVYPHRIGSRSPNGAPPLISSSGGASKRKRSWSRAVFSNLQRKGLERRFQIQKYITKPDRRQLASTLGLTDAQVDNTLTSKVFELDALVPGSV